MMWSLVCLDNTLPCSDFMPIGLFLLKGAIGVQFGQVLKKLGYLAKQSALE